MSRKLHKLVDWAARGWLTPAQVKQLRAAYEAGEGGYRLLAKRYGVSWGVVRNIVTYRRRWQV